MSCVSGWSAAAVVFLLVISADALPVSDTEISNSSLCQGICFNFTIGLCCVEKEDLRICLNNSIPLKMYNDAIFVQEGCIYAKIEKTTTPLTQPDEVYCTVGGDRKKMSWKASDSLVPCNSTSPTKTTTFSDQESTIASPTPTVTSSKEANGLPTVTPNHSGPLINEGKSRNYYIGIVIVIVVVFLICYNDRCYGWLSSIDVRKHIPPLYWLIKTESGLAQHHASSCAMDDTTSGSEQGL